MLADLDDLLTALYVLVDDFLPARTGAGGRSQWHCNNTGICSSTFPSLRPRITAAEPITLAVAQITGRTRLSPPASCIWRGSPLYLGNVRA